MKEFSRLPIFALGASWSATEIVWRDLVNFREQNNDAISDDWIFIFFNNRESDKVERKSMLTSSVVIPHLLVFLNMALIRSTSLCRMKPWKVVWWFELSTIHQLGNANADSLYLCLVSGPVVGLLFDVWTGAGNGACLNWYLVHGLEFGA